MRSSSAATKARRKPRRRHLDKRAVALAETGATGNADDLLSTRETADWLGVSTQFLEIARHRGDGPGFVRVGRAVRYRRSAVLTWLHERSHTSTTLAKMRMVGDAAKREPKKFGRLLAAMDRSGRVNGPFARLKVAKLDSRRGAAAARRAA